MIYFFVISTIFALWVWFLGGGDRLESFHALPKLLTFLMGIDGRSMSEAERSQWQQKVVIY